MTAIKKHSGFTLIEMLVVIVITGVIITMAVMALGSLNKGRSVKMAAEQLNRAMQTAKAQAILMPQTLGLRIKGEGYQFYVLTRSKKGKVTWDKLQEDNLSKLDAFTKGVKVKVLHFAKSDVVGYNPKKGKMIIFSEGGDVTPFALELFASDHSACFKLWLGDGGKFNLKSMLGAK